MYQFTTQIPLLLGPPERSLKTSLKRHTISAIRPGTPRNAFFAHQQPAPSAGSFVEQPLAIINDKRVLSISKRVYERITRSSDCCLIN